MLRKRHKIHIRRHTNSNTHLSKHFTAKLFTLTLFLSTSLCQSHTHRVRYWQTYHSVLPRQQTLTQANAKGDLLINTWPADLLLLICPNKSALLKWRSIPGVIFWTQVSSHERELSQYTLY